MHHVKRVSSGGALAAAAASTPTFSPAPPPTTASSTSSTTTSNAFLAIGGVAIVAVFASFYRYGGSDQALEWQRRRSDLDLRLAVSARRAKDCQGEERGRRAVEQAARLGVGDALARKAARVEAGERLDDELARHDARARECALELGQRREQWEEEDAETQRLVAAQRRRLDALRAAARRVEEGRGGAGGQAALLLGNLRRLSEEIAGLRGELGLPGVAMDRAFYEETAARWTREQPHLMEVGDTIRPVTEEEALGNWRPQLPYDPDSHAHSVFFSAKTPDGTYVLPGWNGRQGTQHLRYGTYAAAAAAAATAESGSGSASASAAAAASSAAAGTEGVYLPVTSVEKEMRTMYNYALCAVGLNITKFMYPTLFKACPTCQADSLHEHIETPLVLFCRDCLPQHHTNEFRLLCRGFMDSELYGTAVFWRARSRLRFKGRHMLAAEAFFEAHAIRRNETLAVRLPRSGKHRAVCDRPQADLHETLCYQTLLKGKALEAEAESHRQRCWPSLEGVAKLIRHEVDAAAATSTPLLNVYVSTDGTNDVCSLPSLPSLSATGPHTRRSGRICCCCCHGSCANACIAGSRRDATQRTRLWTCLSVPSAGLLSSTGTRG